MQKIKYKLIKSRKCNLHMITPIIVFFLVGIIYAIPLFKNIENWGQMDWDQFTFWNAVPRETILRYHQFPLWNPYSNGGNVMLALPHSSFLSPFFILVLLFGPIIGPKVQWVTSIFLGMLGMFFLSRCLKMGKISQYLAPVIFMLCSTFTLHLSEGHMEWTAIVFLPWFFLFCLKLNQGKRYLFLAVIFLSLMILSGGIYVFSITLVFITIYFLLLSIKERRAKYLLFLSGIFLLTFLICAVKLVPMLDFLMDNPRRIESNEKTELNWLSTILLSEEQALMYQNTKWTAPEKRIKFKGKEFEYGWHEYGAYIGIVPLVLAIIGIIFYFRQLWLLFITSIILLWISLGRGAFYNLWALIHKLPIYDSLHVPSRFILGFIFCVSLFSGLGLSKLEGIGDKKYYKFLVRFIIGFVFFDLFLVNYPLLRNTFTIKPLEIKRHVEFKQRYKDFNLFLEKSRSSMYPLLLSNSGIINSYEVIGVKRGEVKTTEALNYKGEVYFLNPNNKISSGAFSPNLLKTKANVKEADSLIVNQNFHKGWRVKVNKKKQKVSPFNGLISIKLFPGNYDVTLYYLPKSFIIGVFISLITCISFIVIYWRLNQHRSKKL